MTAPVKKIVIEPVTPRAPLPVVEAEPEESLPPRSKAWRVLTIMMIALMTAAVLDSRSLHKSATARGYGPARDVERAATGPLDDAARALGLDQPRRLADRLLGRDDAADKGPGLAQAPPPTSTPTAVPPSGVGAAPAVPSVESTRTISRVHPLRLWITGDSDVDYLGRTLLDEAAPSKRVLSSGGVDVHVGTGLVRPDVFDWLRYARTESPKRKADAVVVALGANDAQGINIGPGKAVHPGNAQWSLLYTQRIVLVAQQLSLGGTRPVYWVTLPPARSAQDSHAFSQINAALKLAATQVPGMKLLDAVPILSNHGRYSAYLPDEHGNPVQVRQGDGIHVTFTGSRWLARALLAQLRIDWKF